MRWLCRLATPPGGVVLDPFVGSGSTAVAARAEGFRCIGIDQDLEYLQIAAGRLSQLSLFGGFEED
jgi:site-specific DNA-methyltransferase (adenine-specific)